MNYKMVFKQELTSVQEDLIIDEQREYLREQSEEKSESWFNDWLENNIADLKNDFIESNGDSFKEFCKEIFKSEVCND